MTRDQVSKIAHGLYLIEWKSGGTSLAAVGSTHDGTRWYAPTNWLNFGRVLHGQPVALGCTNWRKVKRAHLLYPG